MELKSNPSKTQAVRLRTAERRIILLIGDLLVAYLALFIALYLWASRDEWLGLSLNFLEFRTPFWYWFLPLVWIVLLNNLYEIRAASKRSDTIRGILMAAIVGAILYLGVFFLSTPDSLPRQGVATFIIFTSLLTLLWRMIYIRIFTAPTFMHHVLVVGAGKAGTTLCAVVKGIKPLPFYIVGLIDDDPQKIGREIEGYRVLGDSSQLESLVAEHCVTNIVIAITGELCQETFQALLKVQEGGVDVTSMQTVYEQLLGRVPIFLLQSDWILRSFSEQAQTGSLYEGIKRLLDILGGLVGVLIMAFFFPLVALGILVETGRPLIYRQKRLGKNGRVYSIIKFRTMVKDADRGDHKQVTSTNDVRITRAGRLLRKSHLDELPQFINILRGEMSLVGPRAEQTDLVTQLQAHIPFYRARLLVKPGLTGWAQVNYGYASTVEETAVKLEYDLYYIKNRSLLLDIIIMLRTFGTVVGFRGQ